jgi:hypothetical protein
MKIMRPLILDYCTDRIGEYNPIFEYDNSLSLNIIYTEKGKIPFMDIQSADLLLTTKTKVIGETDYEHNICLLELETKTRVMQERDDDDAIQLLQLETKTFAKQETDD